ncbi:MAG: cytochrome c [Oxalobacteraceae bacterium]|jgi:mono/diheme cytochrome c family protein|nr:cytochrome c [Oxalobacteraceae bacterium]
MKPTFVLLFCLLGTVVNNVLAERVINELYTVVDGNKVDKATLTGFKVWRAAACDRCHGASQEGMVGPSLITSLKTLNKEEFKRTVIDGRSEKGMPSFKENSQLMDNIENLYRYLKGRSNGDILQAKVEMLN